MNFTIEKYDTIHRVPAERWNRFVNGQNALLHSDHLKAIENSKINDARHFYLTFNNGKEAGIAYYFSMQMDFLKFSSTIPPDVVKSLKHWFPDLLVMNMLECGLLSGIGETISTENGYLPACLSTVVQEMESTAAENHNDVIVIRDVPYDRLNAYQSVLRERQFQAILGFPSARMELKWDSLDAYFHALKKHSSHNFRHHLSKMDSQELVVETVPDFGKQAERLERLWRNVHARAEEYEHEKLDASYFYEINRCLSDKSFIVSVKKNGEPIAFALCIEGNGILYPLYLGLDYEYNKQYHLYFNLYFYCIQEAIRRGMRWVDFGIASYDFKMLIGCELQPLVYFIKHLRRPEYTPALAKMLSESIAHPENLHQPFKNQDIQGRLQLADLQKTLDSTGSQRPHDIFNKAYSYTRADATRLSTLYAFFPAFEGVQNSEIQYQGKTVIMLGSNSYMGLASHPEMIEAAKAAIDIYGTGCSGSPFLNGTLDIHLKLANSLADFMDKEDALLFSTGYQTNVGVIAALGTRHTVLILDGLNHASIVDAAISSFADVERYRHNDMDSLEKLLQKYENKEKLVISDSVFSMEGTMANIPEIVRLCKKYGARLMLDEAHGIGVLGPGGRGAVDHFGLLGDVDIIMGTFSKSFAAVGGFVVGDAKIIDYLRHTARSHMFSASLPPAVVATVQKALEIIIREPERRKKLLDNAEWMAAQLHDLGYEVSYRGTAIVPVHCGNETLTLGLFNKLFREGVYVHPVLQPAVPKGRELLRTSYMSTHNREVLARAVDIFKKVRTPYFPKPAESGNRES